MEHLFWALLFAVIAAPFGHWTVTNRGNLVLSAKCLVLWRKQRIRISCAAVLRISDPQGRYLLARTYRRPETFGPFGGVIKYSDNAKHDLDAIRFEPQTLKADSLHGIEHDLRGFLMGASLPNFLRWFRKGLGRESDKECLKRELQEEFGEVELKDSIPDIDSLDFSFVRQVVELPRPLDGASYWQMRILRVFDLEADNVRALSLKDHLLRLGAGQKHLLLASADQIRAGRVGGRLIAHHSAYMFSDQRLRPEEPEFDS